MRPPPPNGASAGLALAASSLAFCLVLLDTSLVSVALPELARSLHATVTGLQWVINSYALVLASLLISGGALVDRLGARRLLVAGSAIFVAGSLAAAGAGSVGTLVAAQAVLGLGAAVLLPASLSLLAHTHPDPVRRAMALGVWSTVAAVSFAGSPFAAGLLMRAGGWRAVFAVLVPIALTVAAISLVRLSETPRARSRGVDLGGQALATLALGALTFALIESRPLGWQAPAVLGGLALFAGAGIAFVAVERRSVAPMLPLSLFGVRAFSWAVAAGALVNFVMYGQLFLLSLYLREGRGLTPTQMGLVYLSQPVAVALVGIPTGRVLGRLSARLPLIAGGLAGTCGALVLAATIDGSTPYAVIVCSLVLFGVAAGTVVPAVTSAVVSAVHPAQVGVASSALNAARQTGGVLGIAVLGGLLSERDHTTGLALTMLVCAIAVAAIALIGFQLAGGRRGPAVRAPAFATSIADR